MNDPIKHLEHWQFKALDKYANEIEIWITSDADNPLFIDPKIAISTGAGIAKTLVFQESTIRAILSTLDGIKQQKREKK